MSKRTPANPPRYPICRRSIDDQAVLGLFRQPNRVEAAARFAKQPARLIIERVRRLHETGALTKLSNGQYLDSQYME